MFKQWSVVIVVAILCLTVCQKDTLAQRRVQRRRSAPRAVRSFRGGSYRATTAQTGYVASVRLQGYHICAATVVSRQFLLTAAFCVNKWMMPRLQVVLGTSTRRQRGIYRRVSQIIRHPQYDSETLQNDIALLKTSKRMQGRNIRPIPLCQQSQLAGGTCTISGWGQSGQTAALLAQQRSARVSMIALQNCRNIYQGAATVSNSMICGYRSSKRNACVGDWGGPLVCNNRLCGIVSWGGGCVNNRYPGIYTSVYVYRQFIKQTMKRY